MKFNVYEYQDEEQKTVPTFVIEAKDINQAVEKYKNESDNKDMEVYLGDADPYTALIYLRERIIDTVDDHEITTEEYRNNPSIDYLNDERYYSISEYAEITLSDEDRNYVIIDDELHKIEELTHFISVNTNCGDTSIRNPKLIEIDAECVNDYPKCKECFKNES